MWTRSFARSKQATRSSPPELSCRSFCRAFPDLRRAQILEHFSALPLLVPDRQDHVAAAELRNRCRREGIQIGTIDALLAQLCLRHDLTMLTTGKDCTNIASQCSLKLLKP